MSGEVLLFRLFAAIVCGGAIAVVFSQSIVRMAFWLVISLGSVAGLFFLLSADFVAATQLLIYVGGTVVLLVFGVMLTASGPYLKIPTSPSQVVLAGGVGMLLLSLFVWSVSSVDWDRQSIRRVRISAEKFEAAVGALASQEESLRSILLSAAEMDKDMFADDFHHRIHHHPTDATKSLDATKLKEWETVFHKVELISHAYSVQDHGESSFYVYDANGHDDAGDHDEFGHGHEEGEHGNHNEHGEHAAESESSQLLAFWKSHGLRFAPDAVNTGTSRPLGLSLLGYRTDRDLAESGLKTLGDGFYLASSGNSLSTGYLLPFEIVSIHLLVVLIGAAYLARAKRRADSAQ
ncbi:MAG: NADH-quinone oxidoreductase subunit J [Planctomycetota bacterium]|nr:NADH-quinone oxidoreductase subunit J [Planctomycetota bacterium]